MMNRREFLKSLGAIGASAAVVSFAGPALALLPDEVADSLPKPICIKRRAIENIISRLA